MPTFKCDACDAVFEFEINDPSQDILFCPECGETEDITVAGFACTTDEQEPATKKRS